MFILLLVAFISGLLTILAPCIWPILPIVLSSSATGGHRRPLGVTTGILLSFSFFTLSLSYLVRIFHFDPNYLRLVAVLVIGLLGLMLVLPKLSALLEGYTSRLTNLFGSRLATGSGFGGGLLTGISLGLVWAPCAGPILATIAALSATRAVTSQVILLTVVYMLGAGIPLYLFATFGNTLLTKSRWLSPYTGRLQQIFGVLMIATALSIWTGYDKLLQVKLLNVFPIYSNFIYKLEQSNQVREQLDRLTGNKSASTSTTASFLPDMGPAADFVGVTHWLNSEPLKLSDLKGKVVMVDFWTYTCINCIRTLPYVTGWYEKYKDQGLIVVGVHTPEFEFEKNTSNVQKALDMFQIHYPVAQDNSYSVWNNYDNRYWPAKYLVDKDGRLRYTHFGEGEYATTEMAIQTLLAEAGQPMPTGTLSLSEETPRIRLTPETYLGNSRRDPFSNVYKYEGDWNIENEYGESLSSSVLNLTFFANKVFLVITPTSSDDQITVYLDGKAVESNNAGLDVYGSKVKLDVPRLYHLIDLHGLPGEHQLRLDFGTPGTKVFAFTFG